MSETILIQGHLAFELLLGFLLFMNLLRRVRPAYAFYDRTHVELTRKSVEKIGKLAVNNGINYSCWKEVQEYLGEPPWDGKLAVQQGLYWGCIAEDYLGDGGDIDLAIVKNHYYNPANMGELTDFEGKEDIPYGSTLIAALATMRTSACVRAKNWFETALWAYRAGYIRDAYSYLGRVLHLLEDMGCPSHVRNDNHLGIIGPIASQNFNDHLHWDSLEQFCEGRHSAVKDDYQVSARLGEIKKYYPFFDASFQPIYTRYPEPYNDYIRDRIKTPLNPSQIKGDSNPAGDINDALDLKLYLDFLAMDTGGKWLSDDTIPGNNTMPIKQVGSYYGESVQQTQSLVSSGRLFDVWAYVEANHGITQQMIEEYAQIEEKVQREHRGSIGLLDFLVYKFALQVNLNALDQGEVAKLAASYNYPFWGNTPNNTQNNFPWIILLRRRYRLKVEYLLDIIQDRFPVITDKGAALIQRFYDIVRHVDIRGDEEKRVNDWGNTPIEMSIEEPGILWIENCGGVADDIDFEIGPIPEKWTIEVEAVSGCSGVTGAQEGETWRGTAQNVEPTDKAKAQKGNVTSPWVFTRLGFGSWAQRLYDETYEGERGAKIKITVKPPVEEKNGDSN